MVHITFKGLIILRYIYHLKRYNNYEKKEINFHITAKYKKYGSLTIKTSFLTRVYGAKMNYIIIHNTVK